MEGIRSGEIKLLYVAPERFFNERFLASVGSLDVSLFAIDEAHCISQWGHNFRPDYLKLAELAKSLSAQRILALTATATPEVMSDIVTQLGLSSPADFRGSFFRPNLKLHAFKKGEHDGRRIKVRESNDPARMAEFAGLMRQRADVLGIALQQGSDYLAGWARLIEAGLARLLLADHDGELVGGLFLFRQAGIHATAFSADDAARRRDLPGTLHLVRWVAISDALGEGCRAIELGGVDLPGHREVPRKGDPNRGLYEH